MYIQDKVEQYSDEVFERLDGGAHIYFCGLKVRLACACTTLVAYTLLCVMRRRWFRFARTRFFFSSGLAERRRGLRGLGGCRGVICVARFRGEERGEA